MAAMVMSYRIRHRPMRNESELPKYGVLRNFDFDSAPSERMIRLHGRHYVALGSGTSVFRVAKLIAASILVKEPFRIWRATAHSGGKAVACISRIQTGQVHSDLW